MARSLEPDLKDLLCPTCKKALDAVADGQVMCPRCRVGYPIVDSIPLFVKDPERHLDEMERMIRENPAWYKSSQIIWYDTGPCRHHLARRREYVEGLLRKSLDGKMRFERLLDLGCGDGANTRWLVEFAEQSHACDQNLLRLKRCGDLVGDRARLCLADIHHLPYSDHYFDVIFFNHVLEHIRDDERALRRVGRILKPGGLLVLGVPNEGSSWWRLAYRLQPETLAQSDHKHFYTAEEVAEKARASGFDVQEIHATGWGPPHWTLDERLRRHGWLDGMFEWFGSRCLKSQSTSLYFALAKASDGAGKRSAGFEIALFEDDMSEAWDKLVERSPHAWLFHTRLFLDLSTQSKAMREHSLTAWKGDSLVAILPLNYHGACPNGSRVMGSLGFGPAGPVFDPYLGQHERERIAEALVERALRLAKEQQCAALEISLSALADEQLTNSSGVSPLDPLGFAPTSTSTYIVDLERDEEQLFGAMRELARRQIRKAEKAGVCVREASGEKDLEAYYQLHCETYDRTGAHPHPRAYFEGVFRQFVPAGFARVLVAEIEGKPIGFLNMAVCKSGAFYWTGCSNQEALDLGANYLLQWRAMQLAKTCGARYYEVGEAFPGHKGDKLSGLDAFKSGFGGARRPFFKGRIAAGTDLRKSRLRLAGYYLKEAVRALVKSG